ncbi:MAG: glycosyltransferase family protein [Hyphomicrobiales bacterium]|nr:glycosyltransferase family protein [Hyphomicrobiales bacterium]
MERALSINADYAEAHTNLGNLCLRENSIDSAIAAYRRALALQPEYPEALSNLAVALRTAGRHGEAREHCEQAIAVKPGHVSAYVNYGLVLSDLGRYQDALAAYDRALAIDPRHAAARADRAVLLLLLGRFAEGWSEYEWRWRTPGFTTPRRDFSAPMWDGTPLDGRTLLIHAEQGIGSAIQFSRFCRLAANGGGVVLECQPSLRRLFELSFKDGPVSQVVAKGQQLPMCDLHVPMMSLPHVLGTTLETIPADVPYLRADPADQARWAHRLRDVPGPRVGLVWAGNPLHGNDQNRSMPASAFGPLIVNSPQATFFSLQVGPSAGVGMFADGTVRDLAPELTDFADTAAVLDTLDLVISVDTAVAHLAGALGKPVWLMIPSVPEWRWLLAREDSPWYPTMRLFRQDRAGDWAGVVDRVSSALRTMTL